MTIIEQIIAGAHDAELERIEEAVRVRRKAVGVATVAMARPGDTIVCSDRIKPTYLAGRHALVTKINSVSVIATFPEPAGRFPAHSPIKFPVSVIGRVIPAGSAQAVAS